MRAHGRARVSARNPRAFAICDRCGFLHNHVNLSWQYQWAGASLVNKRILVCDACNDVPQSQLRAIIVPADPVPIQNPRTQDYINAEQNTRTTQGNTVNARTGIPVPGGDTRITQDGDTRVTQQTGEPPGGLNEFPGTILNQPGNGDIGVGIGVPYDNDSIPHTGILPGVNYVFWTGSNIIKQPLYWVNDGDDQLFWVSEDTMALVAPQIQSLTISVTNVLPPLNAPYSGLFFLLIVNGSTFTLANSPAVFSVFGSTITWASTVWSVNPGDSVVAVYY